MMISTKGEYALRLMMDLALNSTGEYITIKSIARRQGMPEKYLEQIIAVLSKSGLVKSGRGSKGGYKLTFSPEKITVGMILRSIEGNLAPSSCLEDGLNGCDYKRSCVIYGIWQELGNAINQVIDGITLEEVARRQRVNAGNDYSI